MTVLTSRMPGLGLAAQEEEPIASSKSARSKEHVSPGRLTRGAAGDLAAAVLGNLALHAEPRAVVSGEPGRPGVCLDAQARRL